MPQDLTLTLRTDGEKSASRRCVGESARAGVFLEESSKMSKKALKQLDSIPWQDFEHAYGPATDVPDLLRALAGSDPEEADEALTELHGNIWHQGTVYEASAKAVPFLVALLDERLAVEKHLILVLLSLLARGTSYHQVHSSLSNRSTPGEIEENSGHLALVRKELEWVEATHQAVRAGSAKFQRLLADRSPETRAAAAYLLGIAAGEPKASFELLVQLLQSKERSEVVRVAAILGVGQLAPEAPGAADFLLEVLNGASERSSRCAAALALGGQGGPLPATARDMLAEVLVDPGELEELFEELPWGQPEIREWASRALGSTPEGLELITSLLEDTLGKSAGTWSTTDAILIELFPNFPATAKRAAELSPNQRRALAAVANDRSIWKASATSLSQTLRMLNLPVDRASLLRFLDQEPPGVSAAPGFSQPAKPHRVLIAGASGLIGGFLLAELLSRPEFGQIHSLVRRPSGQSDPKLEELTADFAQLDHLALPEIDDAFVALGTTIRNAGSQEAFRRVDFDAIVAVARRARAAGAQRLIVVSSIGADPAASNFYLKVKGQTEAALGDLGFAELHLLRPSMLYGPRQENRPAERVGIVLTRALAPLLFGPLAKYKPVHAQTVARAMVGCALAGRPGHHLHTYRDLVQLSA